MMVDFLVTDNDEFLVIHDLTINAGVPPPPPIPPPPSIVQGFWQSTDLIDGGVFSGTVVTSLSNFRITETGAFRFTEAGDARIVNLPSPPVIGTFRVTEAGDFRTTETGDSRITE